MRIEVLSHSSEFVSACKAVLKTWSEYMYVHMEVEDVRDWEHLPDWSEPGILFVNADDMGGLRQLRDLDRVRGSYGAMFVCSADPQKAIECYELRPSGFLRMPLSASMLERSMNRCVSMWQKDLKWLELTESRNRVHIPVCEMLWIEASGRGATIHTNRRDFQVSESISELEQRLPGAGFFRCQRSFLVNLHYVAGSDGKNFTMTDHSRIPIGRGFKAEADAALERYRREWNWTGESAG